VALGLIRIVSGENGVTFACADAVQVSPSLRPVSVTVIAPV